MRKFLGEGNKKFIQSFAFSHLFNVCMHYERLLLMQMGLLFQIMSPRCFELGMLHFFWNAVLR